MHYRDCIMFQLAKAYQRVHSEFKAGAAAFGLTPVQILVTKCLKPIMNRFSDPSGWRRKCC